MPANPTGEIVSFDVDVEPPDQSLWSSGRVASYAASLKAETSEVIGLFSIPRLDLEVPLYDKASDLHMDRGIARIDGTAQPGEAGNMGIAGHRDGYFRVLKDIRFGDEMIVTSVNGPQTYRARFNQGLPDAFAVFASLIGQVHQQNRILGDKTH